MMYSCAIPYGSKQSKIQMPPRPALMHNLSKISLYIRTCRRFLKLIHQTRAIALTVSLIYIRVRRRIFPPNFVLSVEKAVVGDDGSMQFCERREELKLKFNQQV